jgi:WD40 repeat protein
MISEENSKIVSSQQKISIYSSGTIKRGFELAQKICPDIIEKSNRSKSYKWKHICNIIHPQKKITSITSTSDNMVFVAIDAWGIINIWNFDDSHFLQKSFVGHEKKIPTPGDLFYDSMQIFYERSIKNGEHFSVAITQDNKKLISIGNQEIKIWDLKNRNLIYLIPHAYEVCLSLQNHIIAYANNHEEIVVLNTQEDLIIAEIKTGFDNIENLELSKNAQYLVVSGSILLTENYEKDEYIDEHSIKIWNLSKPQSIEVNNFIDTENIIESSKILVSYDGKTVISLDEKNYGFLHDDNVYIVNIWNSDNGNHLSKLRLYDEFIHVSGNKIICKSDEYIDDIQVTDLKTGEFKIIYNARFRDILASSLDGNLLACVCGDVAHEKINIWNIENGQLIYEISNLENCKSDIKNLRFSDDGNKLISLHDDGSANIWETNNDEGDLNYLQIYKFQMISEIN